MNFWRTTASSESLAFQAPPSLHGLPSCTCTTKTTWTPSSTTDPELQRNFPNSIWSAAAFNFGPRTVTRRHRDCANVPFGWCGVTSLGDFSTPNRRPPCSLDVEAGDRIPPGFNHSAPIRGHTPLKHPDFEARTTGVVYPIHGRRARSMGGARLSAEGGFLGRAGGGTTSGGSAGSSGAV